MTRPNAGGVSSTRIQRWVKQLSQPRILGLLAGLLSLLLVGAAYLDGVPNMLLNGNFLRGALVAPSLFVYILTVSRFLSGSVDRCVETFRSLAKMDVEDFEQLVANVTPIHPRREWAALLLGALFALVMHAPWDWSGGFSWLELYGLVTNMLMFGLLAWVIYGSLAETRLLSELQRQPLDLDIFDPTPLEPVARQSLATSLAFLGGITLSLVLLPERQWLMSIHGMIVYGTLILVAVLVFFVTMHNTHQVMAQAKEGELREVRRNLSSAYRELKGRSAQGRLQDMEALSDSITAWLAYEKRIEEAPEWPYTTDTLRNLLVSTLLPVVAWVSQVIVEFIA